MNELIADQLPLRRRGTLEIFDVSLKLYKRYFLPIIVWSIVLNLVRIAEYFLPGTGLISILITPLLIGAVGCCLAAAVHGHDVTIKDCWKFASKRYGAVLLVHILSGIWAFLICVGFAIVCSLLIFGGISFYSSVLSSVMNYNVASLVSVVLVIILGLIVSVIFSCVFAWTHMVPLALCLEGDGKDNTRFLKRVYNLMRGHWWRIFGLVSLVGIAILALVLILIGVATLITGMGTLKEIISGHLSSDNMIKLLTGFVSSFLLSLILVLWMPLYYLALGVQYLDLRVRKEALDLEWIAQEKPAELVE